MITSEFLSFLKIEKKFIYLLIINNIFFISCIFIYLKYKNNQTNIRFNDLVAVNNQTKIKLNNLASENNQAKIKLNDLVFANTKTNIRLGKEALFSLDEKYCTKGKWNVAIGPGTQHTLCNGTQNTAIGRSAQYVLKKGVGNIAIGAASQRNLKEGSYNIGLGTDTMYSSETGYNNIAVGYDSLHDNINGSDNVSIGYMSGYDGVKSKINAKFANRNVWIGNYTGKSVSKNINESIAIGYRSKNDKSNQVVIGNENINETNLYGVVSVERLIFRDHGNLDLLNEIKAIREKINKLEQR